MLSNKTFTSKWEVKEGKTCDFFHEGDRWKAAIIHQRMGQMNSFFATVLSGDRGRTSSSLLISFARAMHVPATLL